MDLVLTLHNRINLEVLERKPALPAGIALHPDPMQNFGPQAPLGQWAAGSGAGQLWLEQTWEACLREEPVGGTLDETLGGLDAALSFFTSRELAEKWRRKMPGTPTLEEAAQKALSALATLMALQGGLPPLDFTSIAGRARNVYFAAVQAGMDRNYQPMEKLFAGIIGRSLAAP